MPALVRWTFMPAPLTWSFSLPVVAVNGPGGGAPHQLGSATVLTLYLSVSLVLFVRLAGAAGRVWWIKWNALPIREPWSIAMDIRITPQISSPVTVGATIPLPPRHASWT